MGVSPGETIVRGRRIFPRRNCEIVVGTSLSDSQARAPDIALRKDYMSRLLALLPSPVAQSKDSVLSPVSTGSVSLRQASSAELEVESPRRTRCARRRIRLVRVMGDQFLTFDSHDSRSLGRAGCECL